MLKLNRIYSFVQHSWKHWNRILWVTAAVHLFLAFVFLNLAFIDHRIVLGIPLWFKPIKFALSIFVYAFTLAWLLRYVSSRRVARQIAIWTSIGLGVETLLITSQAARGVKSHYNYDDAYGIIVYSVMGVFIAIVSLMLIWLGIELARRRPAMWSSLKHTSIQMGIWLTVVGTLIGGWMSTKTGHTVGAADGGAGLPFLNWSTLWGDYRVPHFIGLHALQVMILIGLWLEAKHVHQRWLWLIFVGYVSLFGVTLFLTMTGKSVFPWGS